MDSEPAINAPTDLRTWESFYRHGRKRWGIDLAVLLGTILALYTLSVGYGRRLAASRVETSKAALAELAPPMIPDERNAALVWEEAAKAVVRWSELEPEIKSEDGESNISKDPVNFTPDQFREKDVFVPEGPLHRLVKANERAIEFTHRAASLRMPMAC